MSPDIILELSEAVALRRINRGLLPLRGQAVIVIRVPSQGPVDRRQPFILVLRAVLVDGPSDRLIQTAKGTDILAGLRLPEDPWPQLADIKPAERILVVPGLHQALGVKIIADRGRARKLGFDLRRGELGQD